MVINPRLTKTLIMGILRMENINNHLILLLIENSYAMAMIP